jgi:three-Cys-motif partner protein
MPPNRKPPEESTDSNLLFDLPPKGPEELKVIRLRYPVWTENKAKFIERYLYYFVLITKHGTYIDGFAGPQRPANPEMWAAKLVLESEPKRIRHFYLFDNSERQVRRLRALKKSQPKVRGRTIQITAGDFNEKIHSLLRWKEISEKEATFCLLDQRTFQCHWQTLVDLANYKAAGNPKIELFYFLAVRWLRRSLSATRRAKLLQQWWGRSDWARLKAMTVDQIRDEIVDRLRKEVGYKFVKPWPIYEHQTSDTIVYYMIHATDHPEAPKLMARAYNRAVQPKETAKQFKFEFAGAIKEEL